VVVSSPVGPRDPVPFRAQLTRFVLTGAVSSVVDFGLYVTLLELGVGLTPAKAIGYVAGTCTAYAINSRWTFRSAAGTRTALAVFGLYTVTFVAQVGLNGVIVAALEPRGWRIGVAFVLAQGVATVIKLSGAALGDLPTLRRPTRAGASCAAG